MADLVVLHVLEALEGGTARHLVDVVRATAGVEHHVVIPPRRIGAPTDPHATDRLRTGGATVHVVTMQRSPVRPRNARALVQITGLIRRLRPDVVHGHSSIGGALSRLAATGTRRPRVYTPNGLATGRAALLIERGLGRLTDRFIAVSESEAAIVRSLRLVPDDRIVVIPNGIDAVGPPPGPDLRAMLDIPPTAPVIGTIGRLVEQKAPERFLGVAADVLAAEPEAHVVLIGDGPLRPVLADELATLGRTGRFHHVDHVADAAAVVGQFDVFVLLSRFEGGPYSPLEAMRTSVPVVLTDVVGNRDVVIDGISGHLVAESDRGRAVELITSLLGEPGRRHDVGEAARQRATTEFDVLKMGTRLADVYHEVSTGGHKVSAS